MLRFDQKIEFRNLLVAIPLSLGILVAGERWLVPPIAQSLGVPSWPLDMLWMLTCLGAMMTLAGWYHKHLDKRLEDRCNVCGFKLDAEASPDRCPECGTSTRDMPSF